MNSNLITVLTFTADGRLHCDGLSPILRALGQPGLRPVRIGGGAQPGVPSCADCPKFVRCGMSHVSTVQTSLTDEGAIIAAAKDMGLEVPTHQTNVQFGGTKQSGLCVKLPGWHYPVVIDTKSGAIRYDNYNGAWGKQKELERFTQLYGVAKATLIARSRGYMIQKSTLPNGTIRLQVTGV